ncbi:MAG: cation:proton antiporter [Pseudomonadota bacterium]
MDFQWVAIALGDVAWIGIAFALGLAARFASLPPLVGFLAAGFILNAFGIGSGDILAKLSDLGITLLLFSVGLKLNIGTLARPQVWAVTGLHMGAVIIALGFGIYGLAMIGVPFLTDLDLGRAFLIAFALSFSSTVFVVKALEERGEFASLHGRIAIGILIMQDIAAVVFLAVSTGELPSVWALLVLLLIPLRFLLHRLLVIVGHGELLVLYGFLLALGGAELFQLVQLKGDLGALVLGLLISTHPKADELAKTMLNFKELFLLGFFLSIGLSGQPTMETVIVGLALAPLVFLKSALFFALLTRFKLRARTALIASVNLMNFSEFGLIVAAIGVTNGLIESEWLIVIAIALSASFVISAVMGRVARQAYTTHLETWKSFQSAELIADDQLFDTRGAKVAIIGMGGIGTGAYNKMQDLYGDNVFGIDIDPVTAKAQQEEGRHVLRGDPTDADFWDRLHAIHSLDLVMLALPTLATNISIVHRLIEAGFKGEIAAIAKFPDEIEALEQAGVTTVFNIYAEAGAGFAGHVLDTRTAV